MKAYKLNNNIRYAVSLARLSCPLFSKGEEGIQESWPVRPVHVLVAQVELFIQSTCHYPGQGQCGLFLKALHVLFFLIINPWACARGEVISSVICCCIPCKNRQILTFRYLRKWRVLLRTVKARMPALGLSACISQLQSITWSWISLTPSDLPYFV